jgi:hypothetical protein
VQIRQLMSRKRWPHVRARAWALHDALQHEAEGTGAAADTLATLRVGTALALLAAAVEAAAAAAAGEEQREELQRALRVYGEVEPSLELLDAAAAAKQRDAAFRHLLKVRLSP